MFHMSDSVRVDRSEIQSEVFSPPSSPDPTAIELVQSRKTFDYAFTDPPSHNRELTEATVPSGEEEVELILFATPSHTRQIQKIRLASPDAGTGEPGFLVKKPRCYYFTDEVTSELKNEYAAAAMTSDDVVAASKIPQPACAMPWKVRTITAAGLKKAISVGYPPSLVTVEETPCKRTRKGKKTRIAMRKKLQVRTRVEAERVRLAQEKEELDREKRTRRNREKKIKKKAREKAKMVVDRESEAVAADEETSAAG